MLDPEDGYDCDECNAARTVIQVDNNLWRCKRCYASYTDDDIEDMIPTLTEVYKPSRWDQLQPKGAVYRPVSEEDVQAAQNMDEYPNEPWTDNDTVRQTLGIPAADRRRAPDHGPGARVPRSVLQAWADRLQRSDSRLARLWRVLRSLRDFRGWFER